MSWKHLSTARKLTLFFGLMAIMIAIAGGQGIWGLSRLNHDSQTLYRVHALGLANLKSAEIDLHQTMFDVHGVFQSKDPAFAATRTERIQNSRDSFEKAMAEIQNNAITPDNRKRAADSINALQILAIEQDAVLSAILANDTQKATQSLAQTQVLAEQLFNGLTVLERSKHQMLQEAAAHAAETYNSVRTILFAVVLASITMAFTFGSFLTATITKPLRATVAVLEAVAQGDFTRTLESDSNDELGQMARSLNHAVQKIRTALEEVKEASGQVAEASRELAHSSDQLSRGVQNQAASLDQSAASLDQMTATVRQTAENANRASQLAQSARDNAEIGGGVVAKAISAMNEINIASKKIADIITTIDEIAFQTNLLALNATVEAARAGEQGRGFAVVAVEVRNLAQRSATAAREIKNLIHDSLSKVGNGSQLVNQSGHVLEQIVQSVKVVTDIVGEIAAASREQATGIDQVNRAVVQMDQITQANATHTEQLTLTAKTLADSAQYVRGLVSRFHLAKDPPIDTNAPPAKRTPALARPKSDEADFAEYR